MQCIYCQHPKTSVANSRSASKQASVWRRRRCQQCQKVFTTREEPDPEQMPNVLQSDGSSTSLDAFRLALSIKPLIDSSLPPKHAYELAKTVTIDILTTNNTLKLSSKHIAKATYRVLLRYDKRAAMQYGAKYNLIKL